MTDYFGHCLGSRSAGEPVWVPNLELQLATVSAHPIAHSIAVIGARRRLIAETMLAFMFFRTPSARRQRRRDRCSSRIASP